MYFDCLVGFSRLTSITTYICKLDAMNCIFWPFLVLYAIFTCKRYSPITASVLFNGSGTQLLSTTLGVKEYVQNEFLKVEEEIILPNKQLFPAPITLDDFFWAFGILRSRAFSRLRGQNLVLIPLADLVDLSIIVKVRLQRKVT